MKTHNTRISQLANVALTDEQTIGASINWYLTHDAVPFMDLHNAFKDVGLDTATLPDATSGLARFRTLLMYVNERIYLRGPNGKREFVAAQVKHTGQDKELSSYSYSANLSDDTEKNRMVQIGTITYNTSNDTYHWRFTPDRAKAGESVTDYRDRCLAMQSEFTAEEYDFFSAFAQNILAEVDTYVTAPHYDVVRLREILKFQFEKAGCYSLSARGGFWFAPRTGLDNCPWNYVQKVMRAFETIKGNHFLLLTMPKDERTLETAATVVEDGLMSRISDIAEALQKITEMTRKGQHDKRISELTDIIQQAQLYSEMLGLTTDELNNRILEVRTIIDAQIAAYESENNTDIPTVKKRGNINESRINKMLNALEIGDRIEIEGAWAERLDVRHYRGAVMGHTFDGRKADGVQAFRKFEILGAYEPPKPSLVPIALLSDKMIREAAKATMQGASEVQVDGLSLILEADPTLGYLYRVVEAEGHKRQLAEGAASTVKALVEAIRQVA